MDLDIAKIRALRMMDDHGLRGRGWTFEFDNAPRRFGFCNWRTRTISLSRRLTKMNPAHIVEETILHEIAHALDAEGRGRSDHGPQWRRIAQAIGCTGRRCYGSEVATPPRRAKISITDIGG